MDWQEARAQFAACRHGIAYLDTGTLGLISDRVADAEASWKEYVRERGRASPSVLECIENGAQAAFGDGPGGAAQSWIGVNRLSERLADLMHVGDSQMYFTANTTDGMARASASLKWAPGERLLITDAEFNTVHANARDAASEHPISIDVAEVQHLFNEKDFEPRWIDAIVSKVVAKTRLVVVGEILWHLGLELPIRELVQRCKEKNPNVLVMVDGAQTLGQLEVNVQDLGCDMYAAAGHSWLCAPSGCGILAVSNALNGRSSAEFRLRIRRAWGEPESGRRAARAVDPSWGRDSTAQIDWSAVQESTLVGLGAALDSYEELGVAAVADRVRELATAAVERLSTVKKVSIRPAADAPRRTGIIAFAIDGVKNREQAGALVDQLERGFKVACRWVGDPPVIRACFQYYNNEDDIEALRRGLSELV
jgi:selenocysteine lyase/cysteine desulfurase